MMQYLLTIIKWHLTNIRSQDSKVTPLHEVIASGIFKKTNPGNTKRKNPALYAILQVWGLWLKRKVTMSFCHSNLEENRAYQKH